MAKYKKDAAIARKEADMANKKAKVLEVHPNEIYISEDGKFRTYVGKGRKSRKRIQASTERGLYEALYKYYYEDSMPRVVSSIIAYADYKQKTFGIASVTADNIRRYASFWNEMDKPIDQVTADEVRQYIRARMPMSKDRLFRVLQPLKGMYLWQLDKGVIDKDPLQPVSAREFEQSCLPVVHDPEKKVHRAEDIEKIIEAVKAKTPNMRAYGTLIAIYTGMRAGEILALHWEDVHLDEHYIHVHRQQRKDKAPDGHWIYTEISHTKDERQTLHDGRTVPISPELDAILREIRAITGRDTYVLSECGEWVIQDGFHSWQRRTLRKAGIDTITGNHSFRMTYNSNELALSLPPKMRASILGHSEDTNMRFYTHTRADEAAMINHMLGYDYDKPLLTVTHTPDGQHV